MGKVQTAILRFALDDRTRVPPAMRRRSAESLRALPSVIQREREFPKNLSYPESQWFSALRLPPRSARGERVLWTIQRTGGGALHRAMWRKATQRDNAKIRTVAGDLWEPD